MSSIVKFIKETYKKQTLLEAIKAGGWKALIDGNVAETTIIHSPGSTLIGADRSGNKYYERPAGQFGRHRWVVYADLTWPHGQEPSTIDPLWHSWLHYMNDDPPSKVQARTALYELDPWPNQTGSTSAYMPKGAWHNKHKRNWRKYQAWDPDQASSS